MTSGVKQPLWIKFGDRLREARDRSELFQTELCELAGVSATAVHFYETKRSRPSVEKIERLATALGVSPTWLAFGHDGFEPFRQRIPRRGWPEPMDPFPAPAPRLCLEAFRQLPIRLRTLRELHGVSLRALSRACALSPATLSLIELGTSIPLISNVEAIATALGISPGYLAFGEGIEGDYEPMLTRPAKRHTVPPRPKAPRPYYEVRSSFLTASEKAFRDCQQSQSDQQSLISIVIRKRSRQR